MSIGLGYSAGDLVRIFSRSGYETGIVERVTASGQIVVKRGEVVRRFTASGREVGSSRGGYWGGPWLDKKEHQDARAAHIKAEARTHREQQLFRDKCDELSRKSVKDDRTEIVAALRELADVIAQEPQP